MKDKEYTISTSSRVELFQYWLAAINWTLGKKSLTELELLVLSYFLYYNDKYKSIKEEDTRNELLFSTSVKKKIKEEFKINSQKLETYLNKLRKKGIIKSDNTIDSKFIIYPEDKIVLSYNFVNGETHISSPYVNTQVYEPTTPIVSHEVTTNEPEEIVEISPVDPSSLWSKYMKEEENITKVNNWSSDDF